MNCENGFRDSARRTHPLAGALVWFLRQIRRRCWRIMDWLYTAALSHEFASCGEGFRMHYPSMITGREHVHIGSNVHINRGAFVRAEGGLSIGDNVHIARRLTCYTINHNYRGEALPYDDRVTREPVIIERNVWIGMNVTIVPGVTVGEGAVVGAGTVVSRDVPALAIVGSQPPRIIGMRDREHYDRLDRTRKYGGAGGRPFTPSQ